MTRTHNDGTTTARTPAHRLRVLSVAAVFGLVAAGVLTVPAGSARAATGVDLGTAGSFAVLAGSAITNTDATTITGDVGLDPETAVSGFDDVTILDGQLHVADARASKAKDDLVTAYDSAVGQGPVSTVATELGGQRLPGGVYDSLDGTFEITADPLVLDAGGKASTVWVFQTDSTLVTASNSSVTLVNGANPCNVFWQVGSSATLGTGTSFVGSILALTSISINTSATIQGRALARNGAVTMQSNTITRPDCSSAGTPSPSPSPTAPSPSPTPASPSPSPSPTSPSPSPTPASPTPTSSGPTSSSTPTSTAPSSSAGVAGPVDSRTGTPVTSTGTPVAGGTPDEPVVAAPPTSGGPQVPAVPTGSVGAGDGSTAVDETPGRAAAALVLLPLFAAVALYATWQRRRA